MQTVGNLPIRHKTRATYLSMLRLHVFPTLAHREISTIKRLDIQSTIHGLPPQTSAMSLAVIKTVFREALAQDIVEVSPAHGVSGPKIMVKPREFLTWDEISKISFGKYGPHIRFLVHRRPEVAAAAAWAIPCTGSTPRWRRMARPRRSQRWAGAAAP